MERIDVNILGRDYSLACSPEQKEVLTAATRHVNQRTQTIKDSGKITGNERIAVMAAIQVAVELLSLKDPDGPLANAAVGDFKTKIQAINDLLDQVQVGANTGRI